MKASTGSHDSVMLLPHQSDRAARDQRPSVLIAYKYVPQYRAEFFERLRFFLNEAGVELRLIYGDPVKSEAGKKDAVHLDWAEHVPNRELVIGGKSALYQPILGHLKNVDLIIVEQANRLLVNPVLILLSRFCQFRVAYWGHGKDFQQEDGSIARAVKSWLSTTVDWWFAYNVTSAKAVQKTGFNPDRITLVMNTIDVTSLAEEIRAIRPPEVVTYLKELNLKGNNLCIYVGGMYEKKRIAFLLAACEQIRRQIPDFEFLFLGGGVDFEVVENFCRSRDWAVCRGPTFGREKALALKAAKLILMPGLVGLAVIDSFAAETPIVTTDVFFHSPEIEYLVPGVNGEITRPPDSAEIYASEVVDILRSDHRLATLQRGCGEACAKYSVDAMVQNFGDGILKALGGSRHA